jgi:Planctomycete cytochrome C
MNRTLVFSIVLAGISVASARAEEKVDFAKQVLPILQESCGKCHGEKKAQGKMRVHTAAALKEKWDADKKLITAGKPEESELYQRLVLPAEDKKRMPKGGDPLAKDKIDLIGRWIKEGAVLPVVAAVVAPAPAKPAEAAAAPKKEEPKKAVEIPLPKVSAAPKEALDKLTAAGAQVMPLFADSSLLQVSFAHRSAPAGDAEVALLAGVAEQVYALNLADSKASDAGLAPLAGLKNLATLHLERSSVTDAGLAHLAKLGNLQYLNLYGTGITDAGLKHLKTVKNLRRLYLWQTKASYDVAMGMEKDQPGLEVNLGYNHPVVMKLRLTKELETSKKQAEEAKTELTKVQAQFDAAKKNADASTARVADIEKQLTELDPAAAAKAAEAAKAQAAAKAEAAKKPDAAAKPDPAAKPKAKGGKKAKAAAAKAAAEKAAAEKAAAEKAAAAKAAADKAAAEKAAADKAAADKAAADKAAADKAAAEKEKKK